jgi:hypothetical protein
MTTLDRETERQLDRDHAVMLAAVRQAVGRYAIHWCADDPDDADLYAERAAQAVVESINATRDRGRNTST